MRNIFLKRLSIVLLFGSSLLFSETIETVPQTASQMIEKNLELYYSEVFNEKDDPYAIKPLKKSVEPKIYDEKDDPYAIKPVKKSLTKDEPTSSIDSPKKSIKLQVGAFSTKDNAEKFMKDKGAGGTKMEVLDIYSKHIDKTLYKVVIPCNSMDEVDEIRKTKKYAGAFVLK